MAVYTKAQLIRGFELEALDKSPIGMLHGIYCTTCEYLSRTEGDFARHYLVPDAQFLNLGTCPKSPDAPTVTVNIPKR